jgi:hypothetical protein
MTGRYFAYKSGQDKRRNAAASSTLSEDAVAARDATNKWDRHQSTTNTMAGLDVTLARALPNSRVGTRTLRTPCNHPHHGASCEDAGAGVGDGAHPSTEHVCQDQLEQLSEAYYQARTRGESEDGALRVYLSWIDSVKKRHQETHPGVGLVFIVGADCVGSLYWGVRQAPLQLLLRLLSDQFLVILIDEAYTSQLCPQCLGTTTFVRKRDLRSKQCNHCHGKSDAQGQSRPFVFDRDIGAAVNFVTILRYMCAHDGRRPLVFERNRARV